MGKLQWMKWYPMNWVNDTRNLSAQAKGCWIDMLCFMWNAPERGVWKGTYQEFARATGIPWESAPAIVMELSKSASRVTERDNIVTLENRRMVKEDSRYKSHAIRQSRYRSNAKSDAKVTRKTYKDLKTNKNTPTETAGLKATQYLKPDQVKDPVGFIVMAYKTGLGVAFDDRDWDKQFWGRWAASAKVVLESVGDVSRAVSFLQFHAGEFSKKGISWTLRTVADKAVLWKSKERKKNDINGSTGIRDVAHERGSNQTDSGLRRTVSSGAILDTIRNRAPSKNED